MDRLKIIFNGNPNTVSGNINRAIIAATVPLLSIGTAIHQSLTSPEIGIVPPLITMFVPTAIAALEMFRQSRVLGKKNKEMDDRTFDRLVDSFEKVDPDLPLYKYKRKNK